MNFDPHFKSLQDGRTDINIQYELLDIVFLTLVAILCGAEGWKDIQRFGESKLEWLRKYRAFEQGIPRRHTIARIIGSLSPDNRLDCFVSWLNSVREKQGHEHLAIDGKTLRRSHHNGDKMTALHLLSVMAVDSGPVVYQSRSADKKNEIKSVQESLELFDVKDSCVTLDAMHCQKETVSTLRKQQADYVIQIKNNQKTLYEEIKAWFHKIKRDEPETISSQSYEEVDKGHGRIKRRRYIRLDVTDWIESAQSWQGLHCVIEVKRQVQNQDKERTEYSCYISSLKDDVENIARKIRRHWHIENSQHWVLDVVFKEDDSRIRTGDSPENMALFRRFALNIAKLSPVKDSMKGKLKRAAWDDDMRAKLLFG